MVASTPLVALRAESARLSEVLSELEISAWSAPTRCAPWDAAALVGHITATVSRIGPMLQAEPPASASVSAARYYRPQVRFTPEVNTARIDEGAARAQAGPEALAAAFEATWARAVADCEAAGPGRLVATRHGDAMTLEDFLATRVVEVAVHGIDLADAVGRDRWTTPEAAVLVSDLLLDEPDRLDELGWEPVALIAKATGRDAMTGPERDRVESLGITWLTLA